MNTRVIRCAVVAALGGFLFGFDTVVISGAEQTIQTLWGLSPALHGLVISAALWGTVLGSLIGGWPTERFGRVRTLTAVGVLYFVSAVWSGLATGPYTLMVARAIGGVGVGMATVVGPLYIAEISPARARGRLTGLFQFNIVFGILMAFLSNALLAGVGEHAWRWMLGVEAVPAFVYGVLCVSLVESPRWLMARGDRAAALAALAAVNPGVPTSTLDALADDIRGASSGSAGAAPFWTRRLRVPIALAIVIAMFNQLSGINAILYFAPRIFELTGLGESAALLQSIGVGLTNLVFTFVGLWLIDSLGRRTLLLIGSIGYIASLGLCSWAFATNHLTIVPACIFAFIAAHAVGQGAVIWVFISEIFPTSSRANGQALGSFTHWIFAAGLTLVFPVLVAAFPPAVVFGGFCAMTALQLVWVLRWVPETKGVPLEQMQRRLGIAE